MNKLKVVTDFINLLTIIILGSTLGYLTCYLILWALMGEMNPLLWGKVGIFLFLFFGHILSRKVVDELNK